MGKKRFCASILKEDKELQRRLEILIKMPHDMFKKEDVSYLRDRELPPYDPMVVSTYTSVRPQFLRYKPSRHDLYCLGGQPELPPYDPLVPSTYTSARPKFLRFRPNREDDDEENYPMERMGNKSFFTPNELQRTRFAKMRKMSYQEKFQRMEPSGMQGIPPSSPLIRICKLSINMQMDLGLLINIDPEEYSLPINENKEHIGMSLDGYETQSLALFEQSGTPKFESTYRFGAHLPISEISKELDRWEPGIQVHLNCGAFFTPESLARMTVNTIVTAKSPPFLLP